MSEPINDGGPAFPFDPQGIQPQAGMSLRDWLAGQALAGYMANARAAEELSLIEKNTPATYAGLSYAMADAMLKTRAAK